MTGALRAVQRLLRELWPPGQLVQHTVRGIVPPGPPRSADPHPEGRPMAESLGWRKQGQQGPEQSIPF